MEKVGGALKKVGRAWEKLGRAWEKVGRAWEKVGRALKKVGRAWENVWGRADAPPGADPKHPSSSLGGRGVYKHEHSSITDVWC